MQRYLDFTNRELLSDYQKYLYDVRKTINASGYSAKTQYMADCELHDPRAVYFPLVVAKLKVATIEQRRFIARLTATLTALNPEWRELSTEDSKDLVSHILERFSAELATGPSTFIPTLEALKDLVKKRTKLVAATMTLGSRRKRVRNLLLGISGGKWPTTPELSLIVLNKAANDINDAYLEYFATHGDWKMVSRYLYSGKIREV